MLCKLGAGAGRGFLYGFTLQVHTCNIFRIGSKIDLHGLFHKIREVKKEQNFPELLFLHEF